MRHAQIDKKEWRRVVVQEHGAQLLHEMVQGSHIAAEKLVHQGHFCSLVNTSARVVMSVCVAVVRCRHPSTLQQKMCTFTLLMLHVGKTTNLSMEFVH
jgi:hypothetical protein